MTYGHTKPMHNSSHHANHHASSSIVNKIEKYLVPKKSRESEKKRKRSASRSSMNTSSGRHSHSSRSSGSSGGHTAAKKATIKSGITVDYFGFKNPANYPKDLMASCKYRTVTPFKSVFGTGGQQVCAELANFMTPRQLINSVTETVAGNILTVPAIADSVEAFFDINPNEYITGGSAGAVNAGGVIAAGQAPPTDMIYVSNINGVFEFQNATNAPLTIEFFLVEHKVPITSTIPTNITAGFTDQKLGRTSVTQPTAGYAATGVPGEALITVPGVLPKHSPAYRHFYKERATKKFVLAPGQWETLYFNMGVHKSYSKEVALISNTAGLLGLPHKTWGLFFTMHGGVCIDTTFAAHQPSYTSPYIIGITNVEYSIHSYTMAAKKAKINEVIWGLANTAVANQEVLTDVQVNTNTLAEDN